MNNFVAGKETKPRKTAAKALIGFMVIIILLTLGSRTLESLSMANVVIVRPSGGTIERRFELNGYMEMAGDQIIKAEDTLKIIKVHTALGAYVDAGTPLITFDIETLADKLEFAEDDLKRKKLNLESMKLPVEVMTPEEFLANAKKVWEGVQKQVKESEENSYSALVEAENLLNTNSNLIKPTIALTLENFENALAKAQEDYTTNIALATKNYERALRDYNELTDPITGTLAKRRLEAYDAYLTADKALSKAKTDGQKAISNASAAFTNAETVRDEAQAAYDAITDPAKVDEKKAAKDALDAAEAAYLIAQETLIELQSGYSSSLISYQKARDNALDYYNQAADMNLPINKDQIDAALENTKNALKNLDDTVKNNNEAVKLAQNNVSFAKEAEKLWNEGSLLPGSNNTPTEIETALVNLTNAQKALSDTIINHEKLIIQNKETLLEADKARDKASIEATRLDVNNRIAEENRKTDIKNAEQEIEKVETSINRMLRLVATKGEISSPVSGTIAEISATEGVEVTEGAVIAKIASDGMTKQLKANVPSSDAKQLKLGTEAEMYTNMMWSMGRISNISKSKDDANIYVVTFDINPGYGSFNVGDSVRINIRKTSERYYTIVPLSSLREDANGKFVFLLQEESGALGNRLTVRRVDVTVQEQNNERAAVSGSLSDWDKVVERGDRELKDGDRVRIQQ